MVNDSKYRLAALSVTIALPRLGFIGLFVSLQIKLDYPRIDEQARSS
jgi:hypothetical protein